MQSPAWRAERYRKVAAEYETLATDVQSFRAYFQRIAEHYHRRAADELRSMEQEGATLRTFPGLKARPSR
jgi:hypothetical protein